MRVQYVCVENARGQSFHRLVTVTSRFDPSHPSCASTEMRGAFVCSPSVLISSNSSAFGLSTSFRRQTGRFSLLPKVSSRAHYWKNWKMETETAEQVAQDSTLTPEDDILGSKSTILRPSYNLASGFLIIGGILTYVGDGYLLLGLPLTLLGAFLAFQTFNVRFVFSEKKLNVMKKKGSELKFVRGWQYDKFTNWEVWWPRLPILCYFKEKESYNGRGSIHFFPVIFDGKQLVSCLQRNTLMKEKYPRPSE